MTIRNEAARLFFAITALILVGMISAPMGDSLRKGPQDITPKKSIATSKKNQSKKNAEKMIDKRRAQKIVMK